MEPIKAERAKVIFFEGLEVYGYRMPSGEFRVGLADASKIVGYEEDWLNNAITKNARTVKALRGLGFSEKIQKVQGQSNQGNWFTSQTISLKDFNRVICYAANDRTYNKNRKGALALQLSLTELSLTDFFRDAFGDNPLTIDQKRILFYKSYAASISPEEWRKMDRRDILKLALPGDENHLKDATWNSWQDNEDIDLD